MTESLELHFCDLCGVSIPLKDIETGLARTLEGKRIGACCLSRLAPPAAAAGSATAARHSVASWFPAVVIVAAIAAAAWYLDERGRERAPTTSIEALGGRVEALRELAVRLDDKLAKQSEATAQAVIAAQAPALAALGAELAKMQATKPEPDRAVEAMKERVTLLATQLVDMADRQRAIETQMSKLAQTLHDGLGQVDQSLNDLRRQGMAAAPPSETAPAPRPAVPEALGRKVDQLANENPGIRWAAVDEMIRAGDKAAVPFLVPLLKDKDLFVRRLVAEGLATLGDEQVCGSLIDALDDSEAIVREASHKALVKLSGRKIAFDAEAAPDVRQAAVVKWRQWWSEREKAAKTRG